MARYRHIEHGFEPVYNESSRILILGSFPSVQSRKNAFYYGNPNNRFWQVLAACLDAPVPPNEGDALDGKPASLEQSIAAKKELLLAHGIALWDAIGSCDIKGSSDASIKNVVPAQIERILGAAPIGAVVCNGSTAGRLYRKYLQWQVGLEAHVLPSTSPTNAAWQLPRLSERWREELAPLIKAANDGTLEAAAAAAAQATAPTGTVEYASVRIPAPPASSYAVHKSMQGNKRKDTKPELLVRRRLREAGLSGYRLQWKVPGHPDIAWPSKRVAIEVRGCYWHRCPHCKPSAPKKNVDYWEAKFARNIERDAENLASLEAMGWRVHVIWECQLKKKQLEGTMAQLLPQLAEELGKPLAKDALTQGAWRNDGRATQHPG